MDNLSLCISHLGGQVKAVSYRRGLVGRRWESPSNNLAEDISGLLREIVAQTQPDGKQTSIVWAHPRLINQILEVPPAKGQALQRLLERLVQNAKAFPGTAVWSCQPALPTKKANAFLLHLCPQATVSDLSKACAQAQLRLVRLLPSTAVLVGQLKQLPLDKDEVALLAAETGTSTTIVIGRKDGRVALGRVLASSWSTAPERVGVDLLRSIGFAEQQSGLPVNSVWLFGPGAEAQVPAVQAALKAPVRLSPVEYTPFYWAEQGAKLPSKDDGNLITLEERAAPQRARMLTFTGVILLILVLLSLGAAAVVEVMCRVEKKSLQEVDRLTARLQDRKSEWQRKYADANQKREFVRLVSDDKVPPMPTWFLGYLGDVVPDDLVLTDFRVLRTNGAWSLRMAGAIQPSTNKVPTLPGQSLAALSGALTTGPFHVAITNSWPGVPGATNSPALAGQDSRSASSPPLAVVTPAVAPNASQLSQFLIEGIIRQDHE